MTTNPKKTFTLKVEPRHFEEENRGVSSSCGIAKALAGMGIKAIVYPCEMSKCFVVSTCECKIDNMEVLNGPSKEVVEWDLGGPIPEPFTLELPISMLELVTTQIQ